MFPKHLFYAHRTHPNELRSDMGIDARDITFTNYACCSACMYHLLAWQDADFVGMRNIAPSLSLRIGHLQGKTTLGCFLTPSGRFATLWEACQTDQIPVCSSKTLLVGVFLFLKSV